MTTETLIDIDIDRYRYRYRYRYVYRYVYIDRYIHTHTYIYSLKYIVAFQSEQTVNIPASIQQALGHKRCPQKSAKFLGHPPKG